ncbi:TPA: helicase RepA family protein [Escherichia coli]|uniref:helicase RepA family protein n=1 Tax=Escherichia coli TaxID=562 RepID=UPI000651850C|nr:helicase RepA family protein [Escherichia coli]EFH2743662.1 AAA family ATPase [Escherichia coli]EFI4588284.1 AAA family ATPase [Escherichia coli]EFL0656649.1 AAA family ATPase [Escherichia coli]EGE8520187.1 AAA family ATPase [Escherichia coli]PBN73691.1 DNA primase [Escherichia coli]
MKLAPNVKLLPKDKHTEAVIFAGDNAHSFAEHYIIAQAKKAGDPVPPVYLGRYQLSELDNLQIVDKGRFRAKVIRAGNIDEVQLLTIATKLAIAGVQEARLFSENFELLEEWSDQLPRLRETWERGESLSHQRKTTLPMSVGSAGYDTQLDYVVKGIIPASSLCSIYGASGSYKSFLAGSWACHVSTGRHWGGRRVAHGAVLYVVGEGDIGVPRRVRAWEVVHGEQVKNLYLVNRPIFPAAPFDVDEMVIAARQVERETGKPVRMIILDTLARCFGGNDENDSRDMGAFIRGCDELKRRTGATVLVVHHSGKDETKGARGSSAFRASLDAEYRIRREDAGSEALVISCTKMKDAEELKEAAYDLRVVELFTDADGELITSLVVVDKPRPPVELERIEEAGNKTENHTALWGCIRSRTQNGDKCTIPLLRDDMKRLGYDVKNMRRWLAKLEKDAVIYIDGDDVGPL